MKKLLFKSLFLGTLLVPTVSHPFNWDTVINYANSVISNVLNTANSAINHIQPFWQVTKKISHTFHAKDVLLCKSVILNNLATDIAVTSAGILDPIIENNISLASIAESGRQCALKTPCFLARHSSQYLSKKFRRWIAAESITRGADYIVRHALSSEENSSYKKLAYSLAAAGIGMSLLNTNELSAKFDDKHELHISPEFISFLSFKGNNVSYEVIDGNLKEAIEQNFKLLQQQIKGNTCLVKRIASLTPNPYLTKEIIFETKINSINIATIAQFIATGQYQLQSDNQVALGDVLLQGEELVTIINGIKEIQLAEDNLKIVISPTEVFANNFTKDADLDATFETCHLEQPTYLARSLFAGKKVRHALGLL